MSACGLESASEPQLYLPYKQAPDGWLIGYVPKDLAIHTTSHHSNSFQKCAASSQCGPAAAYFQRSNDGRNRGGRDRIASRTNARADDIYRRCDSAGRITIRHLRSAVVYSFSPPTGVRHPNGSGSGRATSSTWC